MISTSTASGTSVQGTMEVVRAGGEDAAEGRGLRTPGTDAAGVSSQTEPDKVKDTSFSRLATTNEPSRV